MFETALDRPCLGLALGTDDQDGHAGHVFDAFDRYAEQLADGLGAAAQLGQDEHGSLAGDAVQRVAVAGVVADRILDALCLAGVAADDDRHLVILAELGQVSLVSVIAGDDGPVALDDERRELVPRPHGLPISADE